MHRIITDWATYLRYEWVWWGITLIDWINDIRYENWNPIHHKRWYGKIAIQDIIKWHNPKCEYPIEYKKAPN